MSDFYNALPPGYRLQEYEILRVLGVGGFGITYLCFDHNLDQARAIKEYLPNELAVRRDDQSVVCKSSSSQQDFDDGLASFIQEAKKLALFHHNNIIKVHRSFQQHGTAYIVMEYAEGDTLAEYLKARGKLGEAELRNILLPILDGLEVVHRGSILHRDIKPGNIIIRDLDSSPVLIDFGAARQSIESRSKSITAIVTAGYAPFEQYSSHGNQGPWTDIYALGCLAYRALSGETPREAPLRMRNDPQEPAVSKCKGLAAPAFLQAIDWAMAVYEEDRPQSIHDWRVAIETGVLPAPGATRPAPAPAARPFPWLPVAVAGVVGAAGLGWFLLREPAEPVAPAVTAGEPAAVAAEPVPDPAPVDITVAGTTFSDVLADGTQGPLLVTVPSGTFTMGSPEGSGEADERPAHQVAIAYAFALGKYEVSQGEYHKFAVATGVEGSAAPATADADLPVSGVDWQQARAYAEWLSAQTGFRYRLPSEAEWEYAAAAGAVTAYPWGDGIASGKAACDGCAASAPNAPVARGSFAANDFGLYDMQGNVWEWLADCARDNYRGAPADGSVWDSEDSQCSRVKRGGAWDSPPESLRLRYRNWSVPDESTPDTGFRLLREITP